MRFAKYHGIGNDFVLVNGFRESLTGLDFGTLASQICNRHFGVGADGLIFLTPGAQAPFAMRMFNPDGSESEMCGNGLRCLAAMIQDEGFDLEAPDAPDSYCLIETGAGVLGVRSDGREWETDLGPYVTDPERIGMVNAPQRLPGSAALNLEVHLGETNFLAIPVGMGNPHLVVFVPEVASVPISEWGPTLEHLPHFPARTNVHFAELVGPNHLAMRPWERGAGATQACGTGAVATAVAAYLTERTGPDVTLDLPGGRVHARIHEGRVSLVGPVAFVFRGEWTPR